DLKNIDLFTALSEQVESDQTSALQFALFCAEECESYMDIIGLSGELGDAEEPIRSFVGLRLAAAYPLLLSAYKRSHGGSDLEKLARWILVFATRHSILGNFDSGDMESLLFKLARQVRESEESKGQIMANVRAALEGASPTDEHLLSNAL